MGGNDSVCRGGVPRGVLGFGGTNMSRIIAVVACGLSLAACSTAWMPSFQMPSLGGGSAPASTSLAVESDPPGAQASAPGGGSCVTPCRLNVTAEGPFSVNVALDGYLPQSVPVRIVKPDDPRLEADAGGGPRLDPNPVYVELERAPAPTAPAKKKKAKAAPTAAVQAPATEPMTRAPTTAAAPSTAAPAPATDTAWPMPR